MLKQSKKEHSNMDLTKFVDAIDKLYKDNNLHKDFITRFLLWIIPKIDRLLKKVQSMDKD